jgi:hypothetical protein
MESYRLCIDQGILKAAKTHKGCTAEEKEEEGGVGEVVPVLN